MGPLRNNEPPFHCWLALVAVGTLASDPRSGHYVSPGESNYASQTHYPRQARLRVLNPTSREQRVDAEVCAL